MDKLAFSVEETADALGVSRDLIYDLMATGRLGFIKAGRRRIITRKHIEAFLNGVPV